MALAVERTSYRFPNAGSEYGGRVYSNGWLSPSSITEYINGCPWCWYGSRVEKWPKAMGIDLPIGGSVHKGIEAARADWLKQRQLDKTDKYLTAVAEHFAGNLKTDEETGGEILIDLKDYGTTDDAKDMAVRLCEFALPTLLKLDEERGLVATEVEVSNLEVADPFPFSVVGRVDALYGSLDGEDMRIGLGADIKTSGKFEAPKADASYQLGIYDRFLGGTQWVVDLITKTKQPKYGAWWVNGNGTFTEEQQAAMYKDVVDAAEHICAGDFPKRPGWRCHYNHGLPTWSLAVAGFAS